MRSMVLVFVSMVMTFAVVGCQRGLHNVENNTVADDARNASNGADSQASSSLDTANSSSHRPFRFSVSTSAESSDADTVEIPITISNSVGNYPVLYDLDCDGDGVYEFTGLTASASCRFAKNSGNHQIAVRGNIPSILLCSKEEADDRGNREIIIGEGWRGRIFSVDDWGDIAWKSMHHFAAYCSDLYLIPKDAPNLSEVKDMGGMFLYAEHFNQPVEHWDTSHVTDMHAVFGYAASFHQPLEKWNVSNVKDMRGMFMGAIAFNQSLGKWDVSHVTNMRAMFKSAISFDQPLDGWNVGNVTDMHSMFSGASSFNQSLEKWSVSNVTDMHSMFSGAKSFNQPLEKWNVGNVTNMDSMFESATAFNQPLNGWNVGNMTNMDSMFKSATAFNQSLNDWNVVHVTNMEMMFSGAESFNQPLEKWNVSNVTNMASMFSGAKSFNQPLEKWNVGNVTDMQYMFAWAELFNQPLEKWNVGNVTNMQYMFTRAKLFDQKLDAWDVRKVMDMVGMFDGASAFSHYPSSWIIPVPSWELGDILDDDEAIFITFRNTKVSELAKKKPLKTRDGHRYEAPQDLGRGDFGTEGFDAEFVCEEDVTGYDNECSYDDPVEKEKCILALELPDSCKDLKDVSEIEECLEDEYSHCVKSKSCLNSRALCEHNENACDNDDVGEPTFCRNRCTILIDCNEP